MLSLSSGPCPPAFGSVKGAEHGGQNGEVFGDVVGDAEGGQCAAGHEQLLADFHHFDEFGGAAVQVHHVAGFARGLGAGVHGHAHVGLGQGGGVVGAVADHGDQFAALLLLADAGQLVLGLGLGDEIVHAGLGGNGGGGEVVVAGDHDGANAHFAKLREAFLDAALDNVLEPDDAQHARVVGHHQRSGARSGDFLHRGGNTSYPAPRLAVARIGKRIRRRLCGCGG